MILELARHRAFDRPVPGVVHARRDLVGEELAADVEELDATHADVVERRRAAARMHASARRLQRVVETGRGRARQAQDAVRGDGSRPRANTERRRAVRAPRDRQLTVERHEAFEDAAAPRRARSHAPSTSAAWRSTRLTLAVVAAAPRLQHRGQTRPRRPRRAGPRSASNRAERRGRDSRARAASPSRRPGPATTSRAAAAAAPATSRCERPCRRRPGRLPTRR